MKKDFFSSFVFLSFITTASIMELSYLRQTSAAVPTPEIQNIMDGKWAAEFEKKFGEISPFSAPSRNLWGKIEFALFNQGRKGVVTGNDGWLFTNEEFSCPPKAEQNLYDNLSYIMQTNKLLSEKNVRLSIVLIPAKARVFPQHLAGYEMPSCRESLYDRVRNFLTDNHVPVTDLLPAMQISPDREEFYLKTDTHWSPAGARFAARQEAAVIQAYIDDLGLQTTSFTSQPGAIKNRQGDLANYIPGADIAPETLTTFVSGTTIASADGGQGLFDSNVPEVTLVGTSYSANPDWHFEGFLKEALKTDVLNAADEGMGPFVVMDKYMQDQSWQQTPPKLVIWEIPERYLLMPHGVSKN
jgi:alginate O-acetyltransferase complex protein AlgJ